MNPLSTVDLYLYALATIAVTFVGFSTLLIVFRQTIGGKLTPYDVYFVLSFMQSGFLVATGALLPPLIALYGLAPENVWRLASAIIAVPYLFFVASVPGRRRRATGTSVPLFIAIPLGCQALAVLAFALEALGWLVPPTAAPFATALTVLLITSGLAFLGALHVILPGLASPASKAAP